VRSCCWTRPTPRPIATSRLLKKPLTLAFSTSALSRCRSATALAFPHGHSVLCVRASLRSLRARAAAA
jgi:hypothetical protein